MAKRERSELTTRMESRVKLRREKGAEKGKTRSGGSRKLRKMH